MADTPQEHVPCTDVQTDRQEVDGSLILAEFPSELLVILAVTLGNPLALLVSKAHLSKAFCEAARAAQATLRYADLCKWPRTVDAKVVAARWSQSAPSSRLSIWRAAVRSTTRQWWRWPRGARGSRRSI